MNLEPIREVVALVKQHDSLEASGAPYPLREGSVVKIFRAAYAASPALSQLLEAVTWIKCSERMPEVQHFCLFYIEGTSLPVMYGYRQANGWFSYTHGQYSKNSITHWMPLPSPPEDKQP